MRGEFILNLDKSSYRSFPRKKKWKNGGNNTYGNIHEYKQILLILNIFESSGYSAIEDIVT